ncbi:septum formation initiator family protein [Nocardioides sp. NPDC057577]|uniref:FtsB family cell division protein n=1 Tax=Nocardioides sp. NPDC057577 TaxID=3346171 RepID=UPI0036721AB1
MATQGPGQQSQSKRIQRSRGPQGPGRRPGAPRAARPAAIGGIDALRKRLRRPKLTGRAMMIIVVAAVMVISYASSLRAYLQQRHDINALQTEIAERKDHIKQLEEQTRRWEDPAYVQQQARERFGFVMPGETAYVALDENGERIQTEPELTDPGKVGSAEHPKAWWDDAWGSVLLAGDPPEQTGDGPESEIDPPKQQKED